MTDSQFHEDHFKPTNTFMTHLQFEEIKAKVYCIKGMFDALEDFKNKVEFISKNEPPEVGRMSKAFEPRITELYTQLVKQLNTPPFHNGNHNRNPRITYQTR